MAATLKTRVEMFLADLKNYAGATILNGQPAFVRPGAAPHFERCGYSASVMDAAVKSGHAERREIEVGSAGPSAVSRIEIVRLKRSRKPKKARK
jgi:hypothetical protein